MFEFYFPDIIESSSYGSWWASLLGAGISGGAAILVFWLGRRSDRKTENRVLRHRLSIFIQLVIRQIEYKHKVIKSLNSLAKDLKKQPYTLPSPPFESIVGIDRLLEYNPAELAMATEKTGVPNHEAQNLVFSIFETLENMKAHSELCHNDLEGKIRVWERLSQEFKQKHEAVILKGEQVAELPRFSHAGHVGKHPLKTLEDIIIKYKRGRTEERKTNLVYHHDALIKPIMDNFYIKSENEYLNKVYESAYYAHLKFVEIGAKSGEIEDFIHQAVPNLPKGLNKATTAAQKIQHQLANTN